MKTDAEPSNPEGPMPNDLSKIAAQSGARAVGAALKRAGEATGVSFELLYNMARRESALDPAAKAKTSSAAGLFQFIEQTWLGAVKNYGARHGLADAAAAISQGPSGRFTVADPKARADILALRFDAQKAAALAGELVRENRASLETRLGRAIGDAELYAAHFLGAAGAAKLLTADAGASAAELLPKAAAANRPVFFDGTRARTVGEVVAAIAKSMGRAAPSADAVAPAAPETKSAAPIMTAARHIFIEPLGAFERPAPLPQRQDEGPTRALEALFALKRETARHALSPLALAVLQALDPTRLGAGREERDAGS